MRDDLWAALGSDRHWLGVLEHAEAKEAAGQADTVVLVFGPLADEADTADQGPPDISYVLSRDALVESVCFQVLKLKAIRFLLWGILNMVTKFDNEK
eukprot:m51a1_g214 hypothetical protein (97) ;mRNA; r:29639-32369